MGATELSPLAFLSLPSDSIEMRSSTVGFPIPHLEVKVVDPDTLRAVPIGQKGEILVRGYLTMLGYYNDLQKTKEV